MASEAMLYQIKVSLNGVRPPIWRWLLVPGSLSLKDLHDVLQVAVGWTDSHLHQFVARGTLYGRPDPGFGRGCVNEKGARLDGVLRPEKDVMTYEYDFGDGWQHKMEWYSLHKAELAADWKRAQARQPLKAIDPLE